MSGAVHMQITTIGLDIAKNVFQVHGIDGSEKVVPRAPSIHDPKATIESNSKRRVQLNCVLYTRRETLEPRCRQRNEFAPASVAYRN
jgi:hypothetical protein